jgi:hypothetical protein
MRMRARLDALQKLPHTRIAVRLALEVRESHFPVQQSPRDAILHAELRIEVAAGMRPIGMREPEVWIRFRAMMLLGNSMLGPVQKTPAC